MKESVLDILIYLFENYFDAELELAPNPTATRSRKSWNGPVSPNAKSTGPWNGSSSCARTRSAPDDPALALDSRVRRARAGAARHRLPRLHPASGEHRHRQRGAARAGDRPAAGARSAADRHRAGEVGGADGAVQPARPGKRIRADGGSGIRRATRTRCTERRHPTKSCQAPRDRTAPWNDFVGTAPRTNR